MTTTARTLIRRAMQKAGILSKNETPSADEANDALDTLNDVLAVFSNETLMNYVRIVSPFTMVSGTASYTIGTGGTFNTSRPVTIDSAYIRSGSVDYEMEPISEENYDIIGMKTTRGIPFSFTYNNAAPLGTLTVYPVPDSNYVIYLRMGKPVASLALDDVIDMPPGWNMFLVYTLAVLLAPEYGLPVSEDNKVFAARAKELIELAIAKNRTMDFPGTDSDYNIYRGYT